MLFGAVYPDGVHAYVEGTLDIGSGVIANKGNLVWQEMHCVERVVEYFRRWFVDFDISRYHNGFKEGGEVVFLKKAVDVGCMVEVGDETESVLVVKFFENGDGFWINGNVVLPGLDAFGDGPIECGSIWKEVEVLAERVEAAFVDGEVCWATGGMCAFSEEFFAVLGKGFFGAGEVGFFG